jgi:hypothetical protein
LINIPVTLLPTTVALIVKGALVRIPTTHQKEEESVAETVVVNLEALDIKPSTDILETARARLQREEDRVIGMVGGGELELNCREEDCRRG